MRWLPRVAVTGLVLAVCVFAVWLLGGPVRQDEADATSTLIPVEEMKVLEPSSVEVVADRKSHFTKIKKAHLVTFATSGNAKNGAPPGLTELHYYERLVFGDYYDTKRDKTFCHFRYRVVDPAVLALPVDRLVLQLRTRKDCRQLPFSWVNGSLVSSPFIIVTDRRPPFLKGLTEILSGETDAHYELSFFERR